MILGTSCTEWRLTIALIEKPNALALSRAVTLLKAGKPVGLPTETVYGLAGDAGNEDAVLAIYRTKARPSFDPLIVHVSKDLNSTAKLASANLIDLAGIDKARKNLIDKLINEFWPGPLTLVLPKHASVSDLVTSGLRMVGIRMPDHPVAQQVLLEFGKPLAAPSANRFGRISPTSAADVEEELGDLIELILDGGPCERGLESTVIGMAGDSGFNLLRPGSLPMEQVEAVIGELLHRPSAKDSAASPGTLASHYAPVKRFLQLPKPLTVMSKSDWDGLAIPAGLKVALLIPCGKVDDSQLSRLPYPVAGLRFLSEAKNDSEASRNLFRAVRELDAMAADLILCDYCEESGGLWIAIKDRLKRATSQT